MWIRCRSGGGGVDLLPTPGEARQRLSQSKSTPGWCGS
jgi:hypothetical protein